MCHLPVEDAETKRAARGTGGSCETQWVRGEKVRTQAGFEEVSEFRREGRRKVATVGHSHLWTVEWLSNKQWQTELGCDLCDLDLLLFSVTELQHPKVSLSLICSSFHLSTASTWTRGGLAGEDMLTS